VPDDGLISLDWLVGAGEMMRSKRRQDEHNRERDYRADHPGAICRSLVLPEVANHFGQRSLVSDRMIFKQTQLTRRDNRLFSMYARASWRQADLIESHERLTGS
jgi:hypothetical protein